MGAQEIIVEQKGEERLLPLLYWEIKQTRNKTIHKTYPSSNFQNLSICLAKAVYDGEFNAETTLNFGEIPLQWSEHFNYYLHAKHITFNFILGTTIKELDPGDIDDIEKKLSNWWPDIFHSAPCLRKEHVVRPWIYEIVFQIGSDCREPTEIW